MTITLRPSIIDKLGSLPETGMGYQIVDLVLTDGRIIPSVMVFNAEQADVPERFGEITGSLIADVRPTRRG